MADSAHIKLIALDLDGTIIGNGGQISQRLITAVGRARDRGVRVMLATGRMVQSARPFWLQLSLGEGPLIAYNGGQTVMMPNGSPILSRSLSDEAARFVVTQALAEDLLAQVYVGDELWISREDVRARHYIEANHIPAWVRGDKEIFQWPEPPIKILLQASPETLDAFRPRLEVRAQELGMRIFKSQADYLEIVRQGVGKGPALRDVAGRLNIPAAQVMAVGDAENDADMLTWAGYGVAMGQAPQAVKQAAKLVTKTIDEDGAAFAIETWALGD
ncbi:MAG: Cof-type HAD-IIB family hydrolase [Firmicutes bacterium]|nr:Cof-type HAD-IIB family hydrolase [Bacillota bacterium]MCL5971257.1 Cof-type HAD-IIB family hydrolase [Bacillota bacterium]